MRNALIAFLLTVAVVCGQNAIVLGGKQLLLPADWTPAEITTAAWYDASDASTIATDDAAGFVSQWNDKSGNGRHVAQNTGAAQPSTGASTINGLNVLTCINDYMEAISTWVDYTDGFDAFMVFKPANTGTSLALAAWTGSSEARFQLIYRGASEYVEWRVNSGSGGADFIGRRSPDSSFLQNTAYQLGATYDGGAVSSGMKIYKDGTQVDSANAESGSFSKESGVSGEPFNVGTQGNNPSSSYIGELAEIIWIQNDASVTTQTRQKIEGYLAWKWGLEGNLPAAHPYKSAAPVSSAGLTWKMATLPPWTPEQIDAVAWYDSADTDTIIDGGGLVSQWNDKSGNARHMTQGIGSQQPTTGTRTIEGLNAIHFNNDYMDEAVQTFSGYSKFVVFLRDSEPVGNNMLTAVSGDDALFAGAATKINIFHGGGTAVAGSTTLSTGTVYQCAAVSTSSGDAELFIDGTSEGTGSRSYGTTGTKMTVGGYGGSFRMFGLIAEVVIIEGVASESDRQKLEGYLAHKWGLEGSLPVSHPYKDAAP